MTILISALTACSSLIGFLIQATLARTFGVGIDMDMYLIALSAPLFGCAVLASAYSYGVVPQLVGIANERERVKLNQGVVITSSLVSGAFILIGLLGDLQISLFSSVEDDRLEQHRLLFMMAWLLGSCQIMLATFGTILTAEKKYLSAIFLQQSPQVGLLIALMFLTKDNYIGWALVGSLFGCAFGFVLSYFKVGRYFSAITKVSLKDLSRFFKDIGRTSFFGAIASSVFGVYIIIDANLAPAEGVGILTALGYAQKIVIGFGNIAIIGVFTVAAPQLKEILVEQGAMPFAAQVRKLAGYGFVFSILLAVSLYFFSQVFLATFFQSKSFTEADVLAVTLLVQRMLPGMVAMLVSAVLFKALFCLSRIEGMALFLGLLWPALYILGIIFGESSGALKFSDSYSFSWISFVIILIVCLTARINSENDGRQNLNKGPQRF